MTEKESNVTVSKETQELEKSQAERRLTPFDEMDREMERWLGRFGRGWLRPFHWGRPLWDEMTSSFEGMVPSVDVIDREQEILVRAELPGVEKKDLEITLTDEALTIKGKTRTEEKEEKGDYYRREVSTGSFSRTVRLPATVDGDHVKTSFKDGLLEMTLPKVKKTTRHTITVE